MPNNSIFKITVDFTKKLGSIKPMNAANNGPQNPLAKSQTCRNFETYKMLQIPYARVHDANLCYAYGAPHTIDIRAIFKNFEADPDDPESYDFTMTDIYLKSIKLAGTEPFFRLGGSIEHNARKWFSYVPPDFQKFAVICEHIIRHCTSDWANGLNMKITYWEVWNEANLEGDDSLNKRCWQGTAEQFREMFCITINHLKSCFPHLKIGGPASCSNIQRGEERWTDKLFEKMEKEGVKLDFYSWHRYGCTVEQIFEAVRGARRYLDNHGQAQAESVLDEWNYVKGWGDPFVYTLEQESSMKGAAFALSIMLGCQKLPLDLLMYYDMRVSSGMNGLWKPFTFERQKPWYSFFMFSKLAQLGTEVASSSDDPEAQVVGAINRKGEKAAVIAFYTDDDNWGFRIPEIRLKGLSREEKAHLTIRLLDEKTNCTEVSFNRRGEVITFNFKLRPCSGLLIQC